MTPITGRARRRAAASVTNRVVCGYHDIVAITAVDGPPNSIVKSNLERRASVLIAGEDGVGDAIKGDIVLLGH